MIEPEIWVANQGPLHNFVRPDSKVKNATLYELQKFGYRVTHVGVFPAPTSIRRHEAHEDQRRLQAKPLR
jgi:hypothetical protein